MAGYAILAIAGSLAAQEFHPDIRRAWDDKAVAGFEMPLAQREGSRRDMTSDEYYKLESLKQKEPETPGGNAVSAAAIFDASKLYVSRLGSQIEPRFASVRTVFTTVTPSISPDKPRHGPQ